MQWSRENNWIIKKPFTFVPRLRFIAVVPSRWGIKMLWLKLNYRSNNVISPLLKTPQLQLKNTKGQRNDPALLLSVYIEQFYMTVKDANYDDLHKEDINKYCSCSQWLENVFETVNISGWLSKMKGRNQLVVMISNKYSKLKRLVPTGKIR